MIHNQIDVRESLITEKRKIVTLWSKVILGRNFPSHFSPVKKEYSMTRRMHMMRFPAICLQLNDALVIDLPKESTEAFVRDLFDVENFLSDDELIIFLQTIHSSI